MHASYRASTMTRARTDARSPEAEEITDREWLVRHCRGDARAFAELVARYRRPVYGYLVRCGVEESARDDLFQDIFAAIHRAAATFRPERPVKPWVFAIVANTVRSHYRKTRGHAITAEPPELARDAAAPDSHELVEAHETAAWLERAIAALPVAQREVVVLCCIEQLPQEEVADVLGAPVNTVKTHLRRARIALAQALARRRAALRREVST